jgi:ABC-type dipeptide/oligopeptide/nickel transport system permease component
MTGNAKPGFWYALTVSVLAGVSLALIAVGVEYVSSSRSRFPLSVCVPVTVFVVVSLGLLIKIKRAERK